MRHNWAMNRRDQIENEVQDETCWEGELPGTPGYKSLKKNYKADNVVGGTIPRDMTESKYRTQTGASRQTGNPDYKLFFANAIIPIECIYFWKLINQ